MAVAGGEDGFPVRRMVLLQTGDPPRRMLPARHRVGIRQRQQFFAPAQEAAQDAIDQALELAARQARRYRHRLVHRGVGVLRPRFEPRQGDQQQAAQFRALQRTFEQTAEKEVAATEGTQRRIGQVHGRRTQGRRKRGTRQRNVEIAPRQHGGDQSGCRVQGLGQRGKHRAYSHSGDGCEGACLGAGQGERSAVGLFQTSDDQRRLAAMQALPAGLRRKARLRRCAACPQMTVGGAPRLASVALLTQRSSPTE